MMVVPVRRAVAVSSMPGESVQVERSCCGGERVFCSKKYNQRVAISVCYRCSQYGGRGAYAIICRT